MREEETGSDQTPGRPHFPCLRQLHRSLLSQSGGRVDGRPAFCPVLALSLRRRHRPLAAPPRRRRRSCSRRRRCCSRHCVCACDCYLPTRGSHGDSGGAWARGCFPAPLVYGRPSANTALPSCYHSSIARSPYLPPPFATPVSLPRIPLVLVHGCAARACLNCRSAGLSQRALPPRDTLRSPNSAHVQRTHVCFVLHRAAHQQAHSFLAIVLFSMNAGSCAWATSLAIHSLSVMAFPLSPSFDPSASVERLRLSSHHSWLSRLSLHVERSRPSSHT